MGSGSLMEKRLFIAVMLSIAFLFGWAALLPRIFPELARSKKAAAERSSQTASPATSTSTAVPAEGAQQVAAPVGPPPRVAEPKTQTSGPPPALQQASQIEEVVIDMPEYVARFTNRGAQMTSFKLKQ